MYFPRDNFFEAMSIAGGHSTALVDRLGERYEVTRTDIKKWTVGSPIQAPLDALNNLLRRRPFEADQVQHIVVRLAGSAGSVVNNREIPDICLQHMIAVMLLDKTASFAAAHDKARMQDPVVLISREGRARTRRRARAPDASASSDRRRHLNDGTGSPSASRPCAAPPRTR